MEEEGRSDLLKGIEGLRRVDPKQLERFRSEMIERVIPEIIRALKERYMLAAETPQRRAAIFKSAGDSRR